MRQDGQQAGKTVTHIAAIHNHVDRAVLDQKLTTLETFRQGFTHGLFDNPRAGKSDQRIRLGNIHIPQHGKTGRYTAHGGIGHYRNKWHTLFTQASKRG